MNVTPMRALGGSADTAVFAAATAAAAPAPSALEKTVQLLDALVAEAAAQLAAPHLQLAGLLPVTWTTTPWLSAFRKSVKADLRRLEDLQAANGKGDAGLRAIDRALQTACALHCHRVAAEAAALRRFPQAMATTLWLDGRDLPAERLGVAAEHHLRTVLLLNQFLPRLLRETVRQLATMEAAELKAQLTDMLHEGLIERLPRTPLRSLPLPRV